MTLRARLTIYYTLFFAIALLVLGLGLYLVVRQLLLRGVVEELRVGSTLVLQEYENRNRHLGDAAGINIDELRSPELQDVEAPEQYVQIVALNGTIVSRSSNLGTDSLPLSEISLSRALAGEVVTTIEGVGSARVLSLIVPLRVEQETVGVVQIAQSLRQVDRSLTILLLTMLGGGVIALTAAARGGLWLTRAALVPIDTVSATATSIMRAEDLHQRVPVSPGTDELARLTSTINQMLERMERTFSAQQRFTADVAHELRTPLAAMRGNLEVLRRGAKLDPVLLDESLRDLESEVLRLTRMSNDLLTLAQADAGMALRQLPMQIDEVVLEVHRELRPLANGIAVRVDLDQQAAMIGDRDRLKQAIINVVANALQHTPSGGSVTITLRVEWARVAISVADSGPGIAADDLPFVFDRFFRASQSRSQGGAGLGLSIARWIVEAHGGAIKVSSQPGEGAVFTIDLPRALPGAPAELSDPNHVASRHVREEERTDRAVSRPVVGS
jgi:two-component system, OmpR family, sensor kinase